MKLLFALLLSCSIAYGQSWDSVRTTDTPNQGRVKINLGVTQYVAGKKVDTTGWSAMTRPILVLQGDTMWVVKDGVVINADSGKVLYMATSDSVTGIAGFNDINALFVSKTDPTADYSEISTAIDSLPATGGVIYVDAVNTSASAYSGFAVTKNNVSIIGVSPMYYSKDSLRYVGKGVLIDSTVNVSGANFRMENVSIYGDGIDVFLFSGRGGVISNCNFAGADSADLFHSVLIGNNATGVTITNCKAYKNAHGFAIRATDVTLTNVEAWNNLYDNIIIKADAGEANGRISINGAKLTGLGGGLYGIYVQLTATGESLRDIAISNAVIKGHAYGAIVLENKAAKDSIGSIAISNSTFDHCTGWGVLADSVYAVTIGNCVSNGNGVGFDLVNSRNITISGSIAYNNGSYGYRSRNGSDSVYVVNSTAWASGGGNVNGTFDFENVNGSFTMTGSISTAQRLFLSGGIWFNSGFNTGDWYLNQTIADRKIAFGQQAIEERFTLDSLGRVMIWQKLGVGSATVPDSALTVVGGARVTGGATINGNITSNATLSVAALKSISTTAIIDSFKVVADTLQFYVGGTVYKAVK